MKRKKRTHLRHIRKRLNIAFDDPELTAFCHDCFPSVHFLLTGLAPKLGFTLETVPMRPGATWVEDEDYLAA